MTSVATQTSLCDNHSLSFFAVLYAYEQCLLCYSHCAEIWYEAALYLQRASETGVIAAAFVVHVEPTLICRPTFSPEHSVQGTLG